MYMSAKETIGSHEAIARRSQGALSKILAAIRTRDLSSLVPLMLCEDTLSDIATASKLSPPTDRQLDCLRVSDEDFVGIDRIVDRWQAIYKPKKHTDHPYNLLASAGIWFCTRNEKTMPILNYSVDLMAILRKDL
ncbi:hypothetical protein PENTCL1PPCAC_10323, partial [Pristionchus entomophagus]